MIPLDKLTQYHADRDAQTPNQGSRGGAPIRIIVLHATADGGSEAGALRHLTDPASEASCHLLIHRDGSTTRLVPDHRRAWHAGKAHWPGVEDVNSESLGWELANRNDGREPYTDAQYATVARLLRHYMPQGLARGDVVGHADVASGRKTDPLGWDWPRMWCEYEAPVPEYVPGVAPALVVLDAADVPPHLRQIVVPRPHHIDELVKAHGLTEEVASAGLAVGLAFLRAIAHHEPVTIGTAVEALGDWLAERVG